MVLNSVSIVSSDFLPDLIGQVAFSVIFGFTFGCYISSVMVVLSVTMVVISAMPMMVIRMSFLRMAPVPMVMIRVS